MLLIVLGRQSHQRGISLGVNLDDYQQFMHAITDAKIQLAGDEVL